MKARAQPAPKERIDYRLTQRIGLVLALTP